MAYLQPKEEQLSATVPVGSFPFREFREGQREAIESVRDAFAAGKRFVVLEAPTRVGSAIVPVVRPSGVVARRVAEPAASAVNTPF